MSDYGAVNSSHICLLPCEDVFVLSQEMGKRASEVFCKLGANVGEVFRSSSSSTGSSSSEGSGRVFTSSHMSRSSMYTLSTVFFFMDAE